MAEPLLELRHVGKNFAGVRALDDVSLRIDRGVIHCLAGENGSGKSTVIKVISGVHAADQGELLFDGERAQRLAPKDAIARGVQVIYQDFSLFGNLTVAENLALGTELRARRRVVSWRRVRAVAREAVQRLGVELDLDAEVATLPTAGRQLVAIARALMADARLLVMDEPTTALTGKEVQTLFKIVREIRARGLAVVFVSHKMREMLEISDRITVLRNGRVVADGPTSECTESSITRAMTGHDIEGQRYRFEPRGEEPPRLLVRGLTVPGRLHGIDLTVRPGEIVGISGLLGSGRTDLALALFGMHPDYSGEISLDGKPVRLRTPQDAIAHRIAYVPEDRLTEGLFLSQSIDRNLLASIYDRLAPHRLIDRRRARAAAAEMIRDMQVVTPSGESPVIELSGGNQQRVLIGRWLLTEARLLILNGPTVGVDVGSKAGIHLRIRELARSRGLGVVMISDDVPELLQNCNRILVMHRGRLAGEIDAAVTSEDGLNERLGALT
jgi:simple sugar transport system ATP-binding protein